MRHETFEKFCARRYFEFDKFWNDDEGTNEYEESLQAQKHLAKRNIRHVRELTSTFMWRIIGKKRSPLLLYKVVYVKSR